MIAGLGIRRCKDAEFLVSHMHIQVQADLVSDQLEDLTYHSVLHCQGDGGAAFVHESCKDRKLELFPKFIKLRLSLRRGHNWFQLLTPSA